MKHDWSTLIITNDQPWCHIHILSRFCRPFVPLNQHQSWRIHQCFTNHAFFGRAQDFIDRAFGHLFPYISRWLRGWCEKSSAKIHMICWRLFLIPVRTFLVNLPIYARAFASQAIVTIRNPHQWEPPYSYTNHIWFKLPTTLNHRFDTRHVEPSIDQQWTTDEPLVKHHYPFINHSLSINWPSVY